jgi:hypothetical protein
VTGGCAKGLKSDGTCGACSSQYDTSLCVFAAAETGDRSSQEPLCEGGLSSCSVWMGLHWEAADVIIMGPLAPAWHQHALSRKRNQQYMWCKSVHTCWQIQPTCAVQDPFLGLTPYSSTFQLQPGSCQPSSTVLTHRQHCTCALYRFCTFERRQVTDCTANRLSKASGDTACRTV